MKRLLKNWGKYPTINSNIRSFETIDKLKTIFSDTRSWTPRGMGRCYGDSSLGENVLSTLKYQRIKSFDKRLGVMECQSGISLDEILQVVVPLGWFLPVSPGTKFVSLGGAVASDIHGKNHHSEGSFSKHVLELKVWSGNGTVYTCSKDQNSDLFRATCGGMGLTGVILSVKFRLKKIPSSYIRQRQIKASNLDDLLRLFEENKHYTYSMAWMDCLSSGKDFGRGILMLGEHAETSELPRRFTRTPFKVHSKANLNIPFDFPGFVLNKFSIRAFNWLYFHKNRNRIQDNIVHYDKFFYPLDNIRHWNRMYGKSGFLQYQFVLPLEQLSALKRIIATIAKHQQGSFLSVLKIFGVQDDLISFPRQGYTLALDFPIKKGVMELLDELDALVLKSGGRLYLTKDARMKKEVFKNSYPHLDEFVRIVHKYNPDYKFRSLQSDRLSIMDSIPAMEPLLQVHGEPVVGKAAESR